MDGTQAQHLVANAPVQAPGTTMPPSTPVVECRRALVGHAIPGDPLVAGGSGYAEPGSQSGEILRASRREPHEFEALLDQVSYDPGQVSPLNPGYRLGRQAETRPWRQA